MIDSLKSNFWCRKIKKNVFSLICFHYYFFNFKHVFLKFLYLKWKVTDGAWQKDRNFLYTGLFFKQPQKPKPSQGPRTPFGSCKSQIQIWSHSPRYKFICCLSGNTLAGNPPEIGGSNLCSAMGGLHPSDIASTQ